MATLTITIPDAVVARIRAAFGPLTRPATQAEVENALKAYIKNQVSVFESGRDAETRRSSVNREVW